ncbi:NTP transferase domain-containing protein [Ruegeria sp. HKCCD7221]|uniref:nucleotidyltransferase family protein n=1 Tax=Ruegeria sp. HKCCD7221 TaxID=2683009 RepID=UPI0014895A3D|nr:nucleotidyltransferase family protein [Ruegeria sp. HKCCD7221]
MIPLPIILLAAGQSRRMGGKDKLLQAVDGMPLLRRSLETALQAGPTIVALPPKPHPRYDVIKGLDAQMVEIPDAVEGMNASLRGAMRHVPPEATAVMVLLADLPDITPGDLKAVIDTVQHHPDHLVWRGATANGKPGHPVVFHRSLFDDLARLTGDEGAQAVVRAHADRVCLVPLPDQNALLDLDTPEDWDAWHQKRNV